MALWGYMVYQWTPFHKLSESEKKRYTMLSHRQSALHSLLGGFMFATVVSCMSVSAPLSVDTSKPQFVQAICTIAYYCAVQSAFVVLALVVMLMNTNIESDNNNAQAPYNYKTAGRIRRMLQVITIFFSLAVSRFWVQRWPCRCRWQPQLLGQGWCLFVL
jgi:hypothetical protein